MPSPENPGQAQDTIRTQNVYVPPSASPNTGGSPVLRGMGYSFGGCIFMSLMVITFIVVSIGGCALIIAAV